MSDFAFGLKDPNDLVNKLEREIARLAASESKDSPDHKHQADHAFNCAVTAWHISDWVFAAAMVTEAVYAKDLGNYQKQLAEHFPELGLCKDLANGSKHFKIDKRDKSNVSRTSNRRTIGGGLVRSPISSPIRSPIRSVTGGFAVYVVEISLKDGTRVKAGTFFEAVLNYWRQFIQDADARLKP